MTGIVCSAEATPVGSAAEPNKSEKPIRAPKISIGFKLPKQSITASLFAY
jgi:hypothetical protein